MNTETQGVDPATGSAAGSAATVRRRFARLAEFGSVLALAISFLALALGVYQTRLMQTQARASVWPHLSINYSYFGVAPNVGFSWQIDNNGVGPARIESVVLTLDDKPMRRWDEVFETLFVHGEVHATESSINGNVLPPSTNRETTIVAMTLGNSGQAQALFEARDRFKMTICYCSVYDECWVAHWQRHEVQPIDRCERDAGVQFEQ